MAPNVERMSPSVALTISVISHCTQVCFDEVIVSGTFFLALWHIPPLFAQRSGDCDVYIFIKGRKDLDEALSMFQSLSDVTRAVFFFLRGGLGLAASSSSLLSVLESESARTGFTLEALAFCEEEELALLAFPPRAPLDDELLEGEALISSASSAKAKRSLYFVFCASVDVA